MYEEGRGGGGMWFKVRALCLDGHAMELRQWSGEAENVLKWQKMWKRFQTLPRQWIWAQVMLLQIS